MPVVLTNFDALKKAFSPLLEGRWMHLTLLFLGERFDIAEALTRLENFTCKRTVPLPLGRVSHFDNRIFYAGVEGDMQTLHEALCGVFGVPSQKLLLHVTLMRIKKIVDMEAYARLQETIKPEGFVMPHIDLMQSQLHPEGARYTLVKRLV